MTAGSSQRAKKEIPSYLWLMPGEDEEIMASDPATEAPGTM